MFKLYCENENYTYNSFTGELRDECGLILNEYAVQTISNNRFVPQNVYSNFLSVCEPIVEFQANNLLYLRIILGKECNFHCKYCIQGSSNDHADVVSCNEDLSAFKAQLIKCNLNWDSFVKVELWGGEPLLYYPYIQDLVKFFRNEIQYKGRITTTTNGKLLTKDKIDFFIANNVAIVLSHDGPVFSAMRDDDDFLNKPDIIQGILRLHEKKLVKFFSVIGPHNPDFFSIIDYITSRTAVDIPIGFSHPIKMFEKTSMFYDLYHNKHAVQKLKDNFDYAMNRASDAEQDTYFRNIVDYKNNAIDKILKCIPYATTLGVRFSSCDPRTSLVVNLKGEIIACINSNDTETTIVGSLDDLSKAKLIIPKPNVYRKLCTNCIYKVICRGGCSAQTDSVHAIVCFSQKPLYEVLFKSAIEHITKDKLIKFEKIK